MNTGVRKSSNAARDISEHKPSDPICATHPDLAARRPKAIAADENAPRVHLHTVEPPTPRVHPKAGAVMVAAKRRK